MFLQQMWPPAVGRGCGEAKEQIRADEKWRQGAREGDGQTPVHPHHRQVASGASGAAELLHTGGERGLQGRARV